MSCSLVRKTWKFGHILVGTLEATSAQYIGGYVMKKLNRWDDVRLNGRHPEFVRMSLKPGIGAHAMDDVASEMMRVRLDTALVDVPIGLRHGTRILPLGRYLRRQLRSKIGRDQECPEGAVDAARAELQSLYAASCDVASAPGMARFRRLVFRDSIAAANEQAAANVAAKFKIYSRRSL